MPEKKLTDEERNDFIDYVKENAAKCAGCKGNLAKVFHFCPWCGMVTGR